MPNEVKWGALGTTQTALSTGLNSLANNARAISAEIDNATNRDMYADFELLATYGVAPSSGGFCGLYLIPTLDGTNYSDGDASVEPPATMLVGTFPLQAVTTAQRVHLRGALLPPTKFKALLKNVAGQAMAASGNTLRYRTYNEEIQ